MFKLAHTDLDYWTYCILLFGILPFELFTMMLLCRIWKLQPLSDTKPNTAALAGISDDLRNPAFLITCGHFGQEV
jgi:hypothetical protein